MIQRMLLTLAIAVLAAHSSLAIWCYQESANVSTSCGGLASGAYAWIGLWTDKSNTTDGDWNTYGYSHNQYMYVNYSTPSFAQNTSLWMAKIASSNANYSLESCWNSSVLQFRIRTDYDGLYWYLDCWNNTDWRRLGDAEDIAYFYEEAMWWNFSNRPPNATVALNATDHPYNSTNANLTAYVAATDLDSDNVSYAWDWRRENVSIAVLNMNFDVNNSAGTGKTKDYSTFSNNGTVTGAIWNATGGWNGTGAYSFSTESDRVEVFDGRITSATQGTLGARVYIDTLESADKVIAYGGNSHATAGLFGLGVRQDTNYYFSVIQRSDGDATPESARGSTVLSTGKWYHVVLTSNGTYWQLYVDGEPESMTNQLGDGNNGNWFGDTTVSSPGKTSISGMMFNGAWAGALDGRIDDAFISDRVYTAEQIRALYNNRSDLVVSDETSIGQNWSVCVTPNDGQTDGTMACSNTVMILPNAAPNVTTPAIAPATAYTNDTLNCSTTYSDSNDDTGNVSFEWYVAGVNVHNDSYTAVANGGVAWVTLASGNFSKNQAVICSAMATDGALNSSWSNSSSLTISNLAPSISANILNATDHPSNTTNANLTAYVTANDEDGDNVSYAWDWRRENVSIAVLNMNFDVNNSAGTGKTKDYSTFSNNGTVTGAIWNATGGWNGTGAYEFNGIGRITGSIDLSFVNSVTVAGRFKVAETAAEQVLYSGAQDGYRLTIQVLGGALRAAIYNNSASSSIAETKRSGSVVAGTWTHFAYTWDGVGARLFMNGEEQNGTNGPSHYSNTGGYGIGSFIDGNYPLNGSMDEVRVYDRALSANQILSLHQNRSDVVVKNETSIGQNWSVCVTPNDGNNDGDQVCSNVVEIATSCVYGGSDWLVQGAERCVITETVDLLGNRFRCTGTGSLTVTGVIFNWSDATADDGCLLRAEQGGRIG